MGLLDVVMRVSMPVKLGWLVCLAWAVVQLEWYRRGRAGDADLWQIETLPARSKAAAAPAPAVDESTLDSGFGELDLDGLEESIDPLPDGPAPRVAAPDAAMFDAGLDDAAWHPEDGGAAEDLAAEPAPSPQPPPQPTSPGRTRRRRRSSDGESPSADLGSLASEV